MLSESASLSREQLSLDEDDDNTVNPSMNQISTGSMLDMRKTSVTSVGTGATKEFFSNITNDINGLANQTSNIFSDLFGETL